MSGQVQADRLQQILDHAADAFVSADATGRVTEWNRSAEQLFGWARHEAVGRLVADLIVPAELRQAHQEGLDRIAGGGVARLAGQRVDLPAVRRDGRRLQIELTVWVDPSDASASHAFIRDVTDARTALLHLAASEAHFRALFEDGPIGESQADLTGRIVSANPAFASMLGRRPEQMVGMHMSELLHPDDPGGQAQDMAALLAGERDSYQTRRVYARADGTDCHVLLFITSVRSPDGSIERIVGLVVDVTEHESVQRDLVAAHLSLRARQQFLDALLDSLDVGIVACDAEGRLTHFNAATRAWHGLEADGELDPSTFPERFSLYEADSVTALSADRVPLIQALRDGQIEAAEMVIAPRGLAATRVVVRGRALHAEDGSRLGAVVAMHDVTAQRALEQDLLHRALHDPLTGMPNRQLLTDHLDHALAQRRPASGGPALLLLDLDGFRSVNDSLGHEVGDQLLIAIGARLQHAARVGDTVARLGGDEFAVALPEADLAGTLAMVERLRSCLHEPVEVSGHTVVTSASIGVAVASGQDRSTLLRQADMAMYAAKAKGAGGFEIYDAVLHRTILAQHELQLELRGAADRGELVLEYQPVLHLGRHEMVGVEALLRWEHPVHGRIPPLDFIPLAESGGSIRQIGDWVLEAACRQVLAWQAGAPGQPGLGVAVNVSPRQLADADLFDRFQNILTAVGIEPGRVTLEVTETALGGDTEGVIVTLERLKRLGVRIAIDDFGTGYSSLSLLRRLPIDVLKIDKSFVDGIGSEPEEWALTTAIVKLATSLGKQTLAEGIELGEQLAHLRALNCELGQGYLFDRPLPPADVLSRIEAAADTGPLGTAHAVASLPRPRTTTHAQD